MIIKTREEVLNSVKENGNTLKDLNEELINNKEIVLAAVNQDGYSLEFASEKLRNDKEVVLTALKQNGYALGYASKELKNDKEVVLTAVIQNGNSLGYASEELRNDKEVVLTAVTNNYDSLQYASEIIKDNKEFLMEMLGKNIPKKGLILMNSSERLKNDEELVLKCIAVSLVDSVFSSAFTFASEKLRNNRDFVIKAVSTNGNCLIQTGELKKDIEIQRIAIHNAPEVYNLANDELKEDKKLLIEVLSKKGIMLKHALPKYQNDKNIVLIALQNDKKAKFFMGKELREEIGDFNPIEYIMSEQLYNKIEEEIKGKNNKIIIKKKL